MIIESFHCNLGMWFTHIYANLAAWLSGTMANPLAVCASTPYDLQYSYYLRTASADCTDCSQTHVRIFFAYNKCTAALWPTDDFCSCVNVCYLRHYVFRGHWD